MNVLASYFYNLPEEAIHLVILTVTYIICWWKSLYGNFLIDDDLGVAQFSDRWRPEQKDANGNIVVTELKVDYYNHEVGKDKDGKPVIKSFKNTEYNPHLGIPGAFMRWHRVNLGKKFVAIGKNAKGHEVYGFIQDPLRHHVWSLLIFYIVDILAYFFLSSLFGKEIGFLATFIFSIHPVTAQIVAWISDVNYGYSLLFTLLNFNVIQFTQNHWITIPATIILSLTSGMALLVSIFNWVILAMMGRYWEAFAAFCISIIVLFRDGKSAVDFRVRNFKEQNMSKSTFFNLRKFVVMFKTLWYYVKLLPFPLHLGLYHEFGYHYDEKMERVDGNFLCGFISVCLLGYLAWQGPFLVTFSIIWMVVYWLIFSNAITANQFVVERYVYFPCLGFSILFAYIFKDYPILFWFIAGMYMARTMLHLWTFKSHKDFYWSNWLNFRNSEVALGNLGVCYVNEGKTGTAIDTWTQASNINPFYDVSWYNLYSIFKSHGLLLEAKKFLESCLKSKTVHFRDQWEKEYKAICDEVNRRQSPNQLLIK